MTWQLVLEIVAAAIASVGGAGAIIWALSSFFGKMWANKILEKQKAEYQKDIEQYKSALLRELENVKATNERLTYISKVQFDIQIDLIKKLTSQSFRVITFGFSIVPLNETLFKYPKEFFTNYDSFFNEYTNNFNLFIQVVGQSFAFLDKEICDLYGNLLALNRKQIDSFKQIYAINKITEKDIQLLLNNGTEIQTIFETINEKIKNYLSNLKVAE